MFCLFRLHCSIQKTISLTLNNEDLVNVDLNKKTEDKLIKEAGRILDRMLATVTSPVIRW